MAILTGDKATETRDGVIRIATDAEASAGTLETVAVNPKQLIANAGSAVGALVYRGTYNATTNNPSLVTAVKGDFYKVGVGGTLAGISVSVGDHIVFSRDANDPVVSADFDVIDSTESVTGLNDLTDVSFTAGEAIDNYVLTYNHAQSRWEAEEATGGASSLDDLSDVAIGTASTGEVLRYNGTNFVDATLAYSDLSGTPTIPDSSDDLTSDHAGSNYTGASGASITAHLSGIDTALASAGASSLDDLSDVALSGTLTTGEVLRYNGTNFVDATLAYSDLSGTPTIPDSSDDLTSDHAGVNYTGASGTSITTHLSGIDTALATATTDAEGRIEIATNAEAGAGTATDKALVPSNISSIELNQLKFVSYTAGADIDNYVLTYDHSTTSWGAEEASGGGGLTYQARDTTAHSPLTPSANYHYSINANSATFVINLPALTSVSDGDQIRIKFQARGDATRDVTINRNGTDTIDGETSITLDVLYSSITLVAGSTEWEIV